MKNFKSVLGTLLAIVLLFTSIPAALAAEEITISSIAEGSLVPAGNKAAITSSMEDVTLQHWSDGVWADISEWSQENSEVTINDGANYFRAVKGAISSDVLEITGTNFELVADRYKDETAVTYTASSTSKSTKDIVFTNATVDDDVMIIEVTANLKDNLADWQFNPEDSDGWYSGLFSLITTGGVQDFSGNEYKNWAINKDEKLVWIADYTKDTISVYFNDVLLKKWNRANLGTARYMKKIQIIRALKSGTETSAADIKVHAYAAKSVTKSAVLSAPSGELYAGYPYNMTLNVTSVSGTFDVEVYNGVEKASTISGQSAGVINVPYTPCEGANDVKVKLVSGGDIIAESNMLSFTTTKKAAFYANEDYNYDSFDASNIAAKGWTASGTYELVDTNNTRYGKSLNYTGTSSNLRVKSAMSFSKGTTIVIENSWYFDTLPSATFYLYEFASVKADGTAGEIYNIYVDDSGILHVRSNGTGNTLKAKTWYDFKAVYTIDEAGMTYTYYLNGEPLYVTLDGESTATCTHTTVHTNLTEARIYMSGNPATNRAYIDNSRIYTLEDLTFTSEVIDYDLGEVSAKPYEDTSDAKSICATINSDGSAKTATMLCAVYSANRLKSISIEPVDFAEGEYSKKFYGKVSGVESGDTIRAMIWNSLSALTPFTEKKVGVWVAE